MNEGVRVDKWLWAARFYRTRAKCKDALAGGKVHIDGTRAKPAKLLSVGDVLEIRQGYDLRTVTVLELSDQRRGAPEAARLYDESAESIEARELAQARRKAAGDIVRSEGRPTKRNRRQLHRFRSDND
jgi:ribosome-associated heat shock protein Hsp15